MMYNFLKIKPLNTVFYEISYINKECLSSCNIRFLIVYVNKKKQGFLKRSPGCL